MGLADAQHVGPLHGATRFEAGERIHEPHEHILGVEGANQDRAALDGDHEHEGRHDVLDVGVPPDLFLQINDQAALIERGQSAKTSPGRGIGRHRDLRVNVSQ